MSKGHRDRFSRARRDAFELEDLQDAYYADVPPMNDEPGPRERPFRAMNHDFLQYVESLPRLSPREIFDTLDQCGYIGQDGPRRALSLMAYRHVQRIRYLYLRGIPPTELPPKSNHLLIGPTGCGKTFLVEQLFQNIFKLPTVIVDITTYSETGYVGQDVTSILTRLMYAADGDLQRAQIGVICLDEFDKIASGQNNAVFAGAGTTKDISGLGVQRELLKLLESATVTVPTEFSHSSYQQHILMSTAHIPFIACGAFSGFKLVTHLFDKQPHIGFNTPKAGRTPDDIAVSYTQAEVNQTRHFQQYGFLPELIARFNRVVPFRALDEDTLVEILQRNLLSTYRNEFALEGIELDIDESVVGLLVKQALQRETGARGLRSAMARMLEEAAFDLYSDNDVNRVQILARHGKVCIEKE